MQEHKKRELVNAVLYRVKTGCQCCIREAIAAAYPKADIQRCIIHKIRSSTRYVSWKDIKALMVDLKKVYQSITEEEAMQNLLSFKEIWGKLYPSSVKSWEDN